MTLKTDIADDLGGHHFDTDGFARTVAYNGGDIDIDISGSGTEEDDNSVFDFLDIEAQASDIPTVTYRTDSLVYDGLTWRYPKVLGADGFTIKLRWIRNQRPKVR